MFEGGIDDAGLALETGSSEEVGSGEELDEESGADERVREEAESGVELGATADDEPPVPAG